MPASFGPLSIRPSGPGSVRVQADHGALPKPGTFYPSRLRSKLLYLVFHPSQINEEKREGDESGGQNVQQQADE